MQSPDVELVEPEALLVKEEKVEADMSQQEETEEDVPLIGDDGKCAETETKYWCVCVYKSTLCVLILSTI